MEHFVQKLESEFTFLPHNSPINLVSETLPSRSSQTGQELRAVVSEVCSSISVLFAFQRRLVQDEELVSDIRAWLTRLVSVLLRVATWREHLFLLHHVLRCGSVDSALLPHEVVVRFHFSIPPFLSKGIEIKNLPLNLNFSIQISWQKNYDCIYSCQATNCRGCNQFYACNKKLQWQDRDLFCPAAAYTESGGDSNLSSLLC